MTNQATAAVYGSYNARSVLPEKVAKTFEPPPQFWRILPQANTVITGPRGSGKTTLLKMLTNAGLEHWEHPRAEEARRAVSYTGVFVPADRSWAGQLERTSRPLEPDLRADLGRGAFTLHVLRALTGAALYRTVRQDQSPDAPAECLSREAQESASRSVSQAWGLPGSVGSFESLRWALSAEIALLGRLARQAQRSGASTAELASHPALNLDVIDAAGLLIDRLNSAWGDDGHVWMLLIDEIEFLPPSAREFLLEAMRGRDPRIMQKVSLAPYTETARSTDYALGGWSGHDYDHIELAFSDKEAGYDFSRSLFERELTDRGLPTDVDSFLSGAGYFERPPGADAYAPNSANAKAIASLTLKDDSFSAWMASHNMEVGSLGEMTPTERSANLRKAIPVILIRDEFLGAGRRRRSRKNPRLYTGSASIFAICENNPRLLKALAQRLIAQVDQDGKLAVGDQAATIAEACSTYFRHLRAIEIADAGLPDEFLPRALVDRVGKRFESGVLLDDFSPEPALSFTMDEADATALDPALEHIVNALVNYGALVPLGPLEEHRYGLSHMFAPRFHLPLRRGRSVSLRTIMNPPRPGDRDRSTSGRQARLPMNQRTGRER